MGGAGAGTDADGGGGVVGGVADGVGEGWVTGVTGTTVSAALSVGPGSRTAPLTDQPIRWSPVLTPVTRTVTGTLVPGAMTPRSHWREPAGHVPAGLVSLSTRRPGGGAAVNTVPGEAAGPLLTTATVIDVDESTVRAGSSAGACTARSTDCWTLGSFCRPGSVLVIQPTPPVVRSRDWRASGSFGAGPLRELNTSVLPSAHQATSRGWNGPVAEVSGSGRRQASALPPRPEGATTLQSSPVTDATRIPSRPLRRPPPSLRLKARVRPSGENAGLSSITSQAPGQIVALKSFCRPREFTGTVQMCLLPPPSLITVLRVNAMVVPSADQVGCASPPAA